MTMDDQDLAHEVRAISSKTGVRPEIVAEFLDAIRRKCNEMAEGGDYGSKVTLLDAVKIAHRMKLDQRTGERLYAKVRDVGLHEVKSWASPPSDHLGDFGDDKKVRAKRKRRKTRMRGEKAVVGESDEDRIRVAVTEALRVLGLSQRKARVYYRRLGKDGMVDFLEAHKDSIPPESRSRWDKAIHLLTLSNERDLTSKLSLEARRLFESI